MRSVIEETGYEAALAAQKTLESEGRLENIEEFVGVAAEYDRRADEPSLDGFLQEISLYSDSDALADTSSLLTLMTLHNAKGLEFPVVFIAGMEEGVFPHQRSWTSRTWRRSAAWPTSASRAPWTGCTSCTRARGRSGARRSTTCPSRFLDEIPTELTERQTIGGRSTSWESGGGRGGGGGWGSDSWGRGSGGWSGRGGRRDGEDGDGDYDTLGSGRRITGLEKKKALDEEVVEQFFAPGDRVLHATLGEGTVLGMQSGGIVLIRFENDGSERRLMASVAPLKKLRG